MVSYLNIVSKLDKDNNHDNKLKLSSNSQLAPVCSICKSNQIITDSDSGELICSKCGQVISDKVEQEGPEWRNFDLLASSMGQSNGSNSRSRVGMSTSLARHDMGLSTIIGRTDRDASGQKIDAAMRTTMDRLRFWDYRTQIRSATDRNLRNAFFKLDILKDRLGLSDSVVEKAAYIYRKTQERGLVRGRTISGVLAAAIYIACREMGISRTLKDIAAYSDVKLKEVAKSYRLLCIELDLKVPIVDPMKYIAKVANKANLSEKTKRQAAEIMNNITKREISAGKNPMGLAASVLYMSSLKTGENITQGHLSDAAGVTEVTLRNRYKDLMNRLELN
ncbi:MAG: transcription initiation factor IIB family protein [Nitrososphaeraceae archaeon]|jgi:transcription initiation factor TFIIB